MKYTKWFAVVTLVLSLFSLSLYIDYAGAQEKAQKFRLAMPGSKNVRADEWTILLDPSLSEEEFERELARVLRVYDAKLLPPDPIDKLPVKDAASHWAAIQVPEARARQIAEDDVIVSVSQVFDVPVYDGSSKDETQPTPKGGKPLKDAQDPRRDVKKEKP